MASLVCESAPMTENTPPEAPSEMAPDDPRIAYAHITAKVGELMDQVTAADAAKPTPCEDFTVKELLEHLVMVQRRVAAMGNGNSFATIDAEPQEAGWADAFRTASHDVMKAWTDTNKLGQMFDVPWGQIPGGALIGSYSGELAVHAWDLATAVGLDLEIDDDLLEPIVAGAKFIPEHGRENPEVPFGPVVDPGADAPALLRLAGWMGRDVLSAKG